MSVQQANVTIEHRKVMTEWQEQKGTVCERDTFIFNNQMWTDVTVVVGSTKKEYECHRLHLAKASPIFAKMVKMDSKVDVSDEEMKIFLPDVEPEVFDLILNYIYCDINALHNGGEILGLLKAIEKYQLPIHCMEVTKKIVMETQFLDEPPKKFRKYFNKLSTNTTDLSWQQSMKSREDADMHILRSYLWTDIAFKVGENYDEKKIFKCHKLMLAKTSPVFAAMLFSQFGKNEEVINIPDITVKAFETFLRYAYTGKIPVDFYNFIHSGEIWDFLHLAKKYLLPERVLAQCRAWIFSRIYSSDFWNIMRHAKEWDEPLLFETCMKVLKCHTHLCFRASSFRTHASMSLMKKLVKSPSIAIRELLLFQMCVCWAESRLGVDAPRKQLRSLLNPLLKHIRFRIISPSDFTKYIYKSGVFTETESFQLLRFIVDPDCESPLPGYSTARARTKLKITSLYMFGCDPEDMHFNTLVDTTYSMFMNHEAFSLPVHNHCWLIGIQIPTQGKPRGCKSDFYKEQLTVYIHPKDRRDQVLHKTTFTGLVKYNDMLDVDFNVPLDLCSFPDVTSATITIIPHISGRYPYKEREKPYNKWGKFNTQCLIQKSCIKLMGNIGGCFIKCNAYSCDRYVSAIFKQHGKECKNSSYFYSCKPHSTIDLFSGNFLNLFG